MKFIASYSIEVTHKPRLIIFRGLEINERFRNKIYGNERCKYFTVRAEMYPSITYNGERIVIDLHGSCKSMDGHVAIISVPSYLRKDSSARIKSKMIDDISQFMSDVLEKDVCYFTPDGEYSKLSVFYLFQA